MLEFVSHFQPSTKEEVYDIMNALDDRLSTPNSAVVLATVKVFLNLTLAMPYDHQQVTAATSVHDPLGQRIATSNRARGQTSFAEDNTVSVQVLERIKDPLVTLISRDQYETAYAVLAHFLVIAQRAPIIFASVRCQLLCALPLCRGSRAWNHEPPICCAHTSVLCWPAADIPILLLPYERPVIHQRPEAAAAFSSGR